MLTRRSQFSTVFNQGKKFLSRFLILYVQPNGLDHCRVGLVVSKKVGNAVTRNRIKRRFREIFRSLLAESDLCNDIVIVARSSAAEAGFPDLDRSIRRIYEGLRHEKAVHTDHKAL